ncbi:PIG-L family deacetylase [Streptomyces sp. NPDC002992]|uniref:PIG-L family deacetylase n=1 Tax=Streptomyces sp. NPDC002992 TaxID=3154273 RepID=UPI0033A1BD21
MPVRLRRRRPSLPPRARIVTALTATALVGGSLVGVLHLSSGTGSGASASEAPSGAGHGPRQAAAPGPVRQPVRTPDVAVTQIVAHPDDDLYFMNPDTAQSIRSGASLTSVYLTSGESDGVNARPRAPHRPAPDKAGFAEARQNGIRAAYAEMATGSRTSPWDRTSIPTAGGGHAELDVLRAEPQIALVWLQLREAGSISGDRPHSLNGLWNGRVESLASQRAAGTPVATDFSYTKEQVIDTLTGLLTRFRPTFVRMQDPTPGRNAKTGAYSDHQDHLYGARFAQAALARYGTTTGRPHFGVQNYLGYPVGTLPHTLDPETAGAKLHTLKTYAWVDEINDCADPAGCGDLKVAGRPGGWGWTESIRYARGTSTSWVQRATDGGLHAFSVLDGRLAVWEKPAGAATVWQGPVLLPGDGLDSGVTSVRLPDGRIAVFGTRTTLGGPERAYGREVVTTEQSAPGGAFGPWRSLGTPERNDARGTSDISAPAVAVDGTGRTTVLLRDSRHRLTARERGGDGGWGPWRSLGGGSLYGDPVATTDGAGRIHAFAGTKSTVLTWTQQRPGGPLSGPQRTGLPTTTLALSASPAPDGQGVRLWFRKPASGALRMADLSGGALTSPVTELVGGVAGFGPVGGGQGMLAVRSRTGVLATAPAASADGRPVWTLEKFLVSGAPGGVVDGVAAMGLDGKLHWTPAMR